VATGILKKLLKKGGLTQGLRCTLPAMEPGDQIPPAELLLLARSLFNDPGIRLAQPALHLGESRSRCVLVGLAALRKPLQMGRLPPQARTWIRCTPSRPWASGPPERLPPRPEIVTGYRSTHRILFESERGRDETIRASPRFTIVACPETGLLLPRFRKARATSAVKRMLKREEMAGGGAHACKPPDRSTWATPGCLVDLPTLANRQRPPGEPTSHRALRRNDQTD
jgi:hypothetical protein